MKVTEKIAAKILRQITVSEEAGWPPICWGSFYQPERPAHTCDHPSTETETACTDNMARQ